MTFRGKSGYRCNERVLRIVDMADLLRDRYYTVRELAERLGVCKRTVQRDLRPLLDSARLDVRHEGHVPMYKRARR